MGHFFSRNKGTANTTTEEVETEDEPKAGVVDEEHGTVIDNDNAAIPFHVSHLWVGQSACTPLVKPKDATSTGML